MCTRLGLLILLAGNALARPVDLRCDYLTNPLGIDAGQPVNTTSN